jgi:hypothetical protein
MFNGFFPIIEQRDSIIFSFMQKIGLDPFYNGLGIKKGEYSLRKMFQNDFAIGLAEVKKLKKCIYEGFRLNTATWNIDKNTYTYDATGEKVKIYSDLVKPLPMHESFAQIRPRKILLRKLLFEENYYTNSYRFAAERVSVADGYIDIDETFAFLA